ncbi:microtubule-associated tumor suppressor candidate 2 [Sardina pilchardus]|uniref:microtubule-associated tumor suppressor candidate 2 n=1 Tax=Sardina pilchardus TaxID=27697 RepID=UPI002E14358D
MSFKDNSVNQVESNTQDSPDEVSNNNQQEEVASDNGDANANRIQVDEERTGEVEGFSPLLSQTEEQDKVIIWGTDSQFDDPELAEFEMLECQELEAFLAEEDDEVLPIDGVAETGSLSKSGPSEANASTSNKEEEVKGVQHVFKEPETASQASPSKGGNKTEVSSETDIFVSCFSSVSSLGGSLASALDNAGRSQATDSWQVLSGPYRTLSEDLTLASQSCSTISERGRGSQRAAAPAAESTKHLSGVDMNLNSTVLPEEPFLEAQEKEPGQSSPEECSGLLTNGVVGKSNRNVTSAKWEHIKLTDAEQSQGEQLNDDHQPTDAKTSRSQSQPTKLATSDGTHSLEQHPAQPKPVLSTKKTSATRQVPASPTHNVNGKPAKSDEVSDVNVIPSKPIGKSLSCQSVSPTSLIKKQASFERARSASPSSLDKRKPWGSPSRPSTPPSPKTTWSPKRRPLSSPAKTTSTRAPSQERSDSPQRAASGIKPPSKVGVSTGIPKAVLHPQPEIKPANKNTSPPQKPKNVRPKIITYVRKSPQVKPQVTDGPYEVSTLPPRLTPYASPPAAKETKATGVKTSAILSSSNLLYDKYKQEMQKSGYFGPGLVGSGIRPPSYTVPHKLTGKSESFHGELPERYMHEMGRATGGTPGPPPGAADVAAVYRSPRALRPQLGLGAVARQQPAAKNRMMMAAGQRSSLSFSQPAPGGPPTHHYQDPTVDQKKLLALEGGPKTLLPKPGQSGLRPPGFAHLPPARLAAFGFVRSASVSSVSSNQSSDSTHSDPCRSTNRPASGSGLEDVVPVQRAPAPPSEPPCPVRRGSPQPPNAPLPTRRSFPPPTRSSPVASRKEFQKDSEHAKPAVSSPKRFAVVSPKPQSPVRQKSSVGRSSAQEAEREREKERERERALVEKLRQRCEEQARQLQSLQAELSKASRGLEVFAITTQHFCQKSERASVKERELSHELGRIRDEVACSVARWERLRGEKQQLEERFEQELRGLRQQHQLELGALEERLICQHRAHTHRLQRQQHQQLDELRAQHQEQVEEMTDNHEATLQEMEETHNATLATLQEEHARTIRNLKMAHEQQRKSLEQEFEKLRLSLQDQVDTLTFQNRSLRDRAKRFEEALRRSTDEQIVDALAPYRHIEEDLKSLKEVLEMKNQQIHEQELKILELEKMAQKNVVLEERVQVLQQQNEDLRARIETNIATSRQLSEENANLQEYVEKESNEKKRLSRNNEELLWRLQTGELSPRMSPSGSPIHRAASGATSPSHVQNFPR